MPHAPIEAALTDLRVAGSVLVHESYPSSFAIDIPDEAELRRLLGVSAAVRVLPFHLVWRGSIELTGATPRPLVVREREVAVCVAGAKHRIGSGKRAVPVPLERVLASPTAPSAPATSASIECICGAFLLQALPLNPLLACLPAVLQLSTADGSRAPLLGHAVEMLAVELGQGRRDSFTASRILEIICAEAIHAYRHTVAAPCWLRGIADPKVGPAIAQVHAAPGEPWTVAALAAIVGISPSRFAAHFRETTGETAMAYVTRWRMHVACRALCSSGTGIAQVASDAGYSDVAAFGRAFKALVGQSPASWRKAQSTLASTSC